MVMEIVFSVVLFFVGVVVFVVIHICIAERAFRGRYEDDSMVQISSNGTKKMSSEDLKMLPSFDYKAAEKGSSPVDCVVCLENFRKGDKCKLLPNCKHSFHSQCIDSWLLKTPICPICRTSSDPSKVGMIFREERGVSSHDGAELV